MCLPRHHFIYTYIHKVHVHDNLLIVAQEDISELRAKLSSLEPIKEVPPAISVSSVPPPSKSLSSSISDSHELHSSITRCRIML